MPVLFLHFSFIFIIIGAGITRYVSEEGVMRIREGSLNNQFISSNQFLEFKRFCLTLYNCYNLVEKMIINSVHKSLYRI